MAVGLGLLDPKVSVGLGTEEEVAGGRKMMGQAAAAEELMG